MMVIPKEIPVLTNVTSEELELKLLYEQSYSFRKIISNWQVLPPTRRKHFKINYF